MLRQCSFNILHVHNYSYVQASKSSKWYWNITFKSQDSSPGPAIGNYNNGICKLYDATFFQLIAVVNESSTFKAETIDSAVESCWEMVCKALLLDYIGNVA